MTSNPAASSALPVQLSPRDRHAILENVLAALLKRFYSPEKLREELVKRSVEEVARKLDRTPKAIRNVLRRPQLSVREIRCDLFSVESLASALHVRKAEIISWIDQNWLQASVNGGGKRNSYTITPEALAQLYKHHKTDLLKRGIPNLSLFEAYLQYCYSPKHTVGEQLLDVRRDKRERAACAADEKKRLKGGEEEDDHDESVEEGYHISAEGVHNYGRGPAE